MNWKKQKYTNNREDIIVLGTVGSNKQVEENRGLTWVYHPCISGSSEG